MTRQLQSMVTKTLRQHPESLRGNKREKSVSFIQLPVSSYTNKLGKKIKSGSLPLAFGGRKKKTYPDVSPKRINKQSSTRNKPVCLLSRLVQENMGYPLSLFTDRRPPSEKTTTEKQRVERKLPRRSETVTQRSVCFSFVSFVIHSCFLSLIFSIGTASRRPPPLFATPSHLPFLPSLPISSSSSSCCLLMLLDLWQKKKTPRNQGRVCLLDECVRVGACIWKEREQGGGEERGGCWRSTWRSPLPYPDLLLPVCCHPDGRG